MLALFPGWLKWAAAGLAGALLVAGGLYTLGKHEGRQQAALAAAKAVSKAYKDRNDENASVEGLTPEQLCYELGGLPDECSKLRRVGKDQP